MQHLKARCYKLWYKDCVHVRLQIAQTPSSKSDGDEGVKVTAAACEWTAANHGKEPGNDTQNQTNQEEQRAYLGTRARLFTSHKVE